jgi:hypothetical protein
LEKSPAGRPIRSRIFLTLPLDSSTIAPIGRHVLGKVQEFVPRGSTWKKDV